MKTKTFSSNLSLLLFTMRLWDTRNGPRPCFEGCSNRKAAQPVIPEDAATCGA
jgi:hypothetical protein